MKRLSSKLLVYEAVYALNQGFESILSDLDRLNRLGFKREFLSACRVIIEETRVWANFEVVEVLERREQTDWERFSRLRQATERKLEDPSDIILNTKKMKKTLVTPSRLLKSDVFADTLCPRVSG